MSERKVSFEVGGPLAPPRKNGELVFAAPWESRTFGMTVALHQQGVFEWDEFRDCLIAEIARWEREHGSGCPEAEWSYYARWQAALETLLARKGVCGTTELEVRENDLAARPPGHDHIRR